LTYGNAPDSCAGLCENRNPADGQTRSGAAHVVAGTGGVELGQFTLDVGYYLGMVTSGVIKTGP